MVKQGITVHAKRCFENHRFLTSYTEWKSMSYCTRKKPDTGVLRASSLTDIIIIIIMIISTLLTDVVKRGAICASKQIMAHVNI